MTLCMNAVVGLRAMFIAVGSIRRIWASSVAKSSQPDLESRCLPVLPMRRRDMAKKKAAKKAAKKADKKSKKK